MNFKDCWKKDLETHKIDNRECFELAEEFFNLGRDEAIKDISNEFGLKIAKIIKLQQGKKNDK